MTRRVYTDIPNDQINFVIAMIGHSNGQIIEQGKEPDGENFLIIEYPDAEKNGRVAEKAAAKGDHPWMTIAESEINQVELPGVANNPRISSYFEATSLGEQPDSVPWCSAFVNWVMREAGCEYTNSAMARSWVDYGKNSGGLLPGCIVVLKRGDPPAGHVGFCVKSDDDTVWLLGGNQGDQVKVAGFDKSRVIAHRLPK